jgi:uncharacterized protein involved in exopolysaccharide biosynthesis/Mrp family chromosome partitioning ATPase
MAVVSVKNDSSVATQVGSPLLGQIRDFIEADGPPPVDPLGIVARTVRGRVVQIGIVTAVVATMLALLAWLTISPRYQSTGVVRILPREAKLLYADADDSRLKLYDAFTNAEVHLMQSRTILENAWHSLHDQFHQPTSQRFTMPKDAGELGQLITITNRKGLVTVAAKSSDRVLSAVAVNSVIGAYEGHKEEARNRINEVRRNELEELQRQQAGALEALDANYLEIGGEHDIISLSKAHIAKTAQLEVLEERIGEMDDTIAHFQQTGAVGADDIRDADIQRALLLDQAMAEMTYERATRLAELATLRSRYRPTHNRVVTAQLELETLEAAISERQDQITTLGNVGALTGGTSQSSEQSMDELESIREKLLGRRIDLRTEAGELIGKLVKIRRVVAEQQRIGILLEQTKRALDEVIVESQAGLSRSIDVIARAKIPKRPIEDKRKPMAFGAAFFGAIATLVGFVLLSLLNTRVRYTDDLKPGLSKKIAVVIPSAHDDDADLMHAGFKLRNEVDIRRTAAEEAIVVAVGGTTSATDTSRIAVALSAMFSAGNVSVLLIDANATPRITGQFALDGRSGLANVMSEATPIAETVEPVAMAHGSVDVLAAGTVAEGKSRGPVMTSTLQDFRDLIDSAKSTYDVVLLDLGEMAAGRHSALAASGSDQLILVAMAGDHKRDIANATTLLDQVTPDRYLLVFDEASRLDPMLHHERNETSRIKWQANLFNRLQNHLEPT